jgi:glycosyltransferase involved in cell wall biosynthesis
MKIGIANSLNLEKRTGVEEYVYQLLKHFLMVDDYGNHQFFYLNRQNLKWPFKFFWTQIRLSREMLKNKPDVLFIPAHTFPFFTKKLVITIHGLEYENVPQAYSWREKMKLRFLTKRNAKKADKIIVPSQFVKNDLIKFYQINPEKIFVIHHGVEIQNFQPKVVSSREEKYILYFGGYHKRKNVENLKKAYEILKKKYNIKQKLILAGVNKYISADEKWELLKNADVMIYPSLCEGFGFPPLEAQSAGVSVVSSNVSAMPEILGSSALLVNPHNPEEIAEAIYKILNNDNLRNELIEKGQENVKRFSWPKCASETLKIIIS